MVSRLVCFCDCEHDGEVEATTNVRFMRDGREYELDLCAEHNDEFVAFEQAQALWQDTARLVIASGGKPRAPVSDTTERRKENTAIREWAAAQGIQLGDRGRIPEHLREQFRTALGRDARGRWDQASKSH